MTKLKNSQCDKTQTHNLTSQNVTKLKYSKFYKILKLNMTKSKKSKNLTTLTQNMTKYKNSKCDKTQKLRM